MKTVGKRHIRVMVKLDEKVRGIINQKGNAAGTKKAECNYTSEQNS